MQRRMSSRRGIQLMYYPLIMTNTRIVLSKYVWKLRNENKTYTLKWRIMKNRKRTEMLLKDVTFV